MKLNDYQLTLLHTHAVFVYNAFKKTRIKYDSSNEEEYLRKSNEAEYEYNKSAYQLDSLISILLGKKVWCADKAANIFSDTPPSKGHVKNFMDKF